MDYSNSFWYYITDNTCYRSNMKWVTWIFWGTIFTAWGLVLTWFLIEQKVGL